MPAGEVATASSNSRRSVSRSYIGPACARRAAKSEKTHEIAIDFRVQAQPPRKDRRPAKTRAAQDDLLGTARSHGHGTLTLAHLDDCQPRSEWHERCGCVAVDATHGYIAQSRRRCDSPDTPRSPPQGCRTSARDASTLEDNPSTLEASGDALGLTTVGSRVFLYVNGQDGGGVHDASLGCVTTPTTWAWFTVHAPLNLSFNSLLLSLKCLPSTRSFLRSGALCADAHNFFSFYFCVSC